MVDKLWWDWQNANPANFWSFGGGSVSEMLPGLVPNRAFPVGVPPYMNVRGRLTNFSPPFSCDLTETPVVLDADPNGWDFERVHRL